MKKFFNRLDWIIDYYFLYFMFNSRKLNKYHEYMTKKWGEKYDSPFDW